MTTPQTLFIMLHLIVITQGKDWFIGTGGARTLECGNFTNPCPSIQALQAGGHLESGDVILFLNQDQPLEHCMDEPLELSVNISSFSHQVALRCTSASHGRVLYLRGTYGLLNTAPLGDTPETTSESDDFNKGDEDMETETEEERNCDFQSDTGIPGMRILYGNGLFHISNLAFQTGDIIAMNASVHISNCNFGHSTIRFANENLSIKSYDVFGSLMASNQACGVGVLELVNTTFEMSTASDVTTLLEAAILERDVLVPCENVQFAMTGSDVSNRRFILAASNSMTVYVSETSFEGSGQNETKIGGITVMAPFYCKYIHIEQCSFVNLYPKDQLIRYFYEASWSLAPILIKNNLQKEYTSYSGSYKPKVTTLMIMNNTFYGNHGAVSIDGLDGSALLYENNFKENRVLIGGGATRIRSSNAVGHNTYEQKIIITVVNSEFLQNTAGILPQKESSLGGHNWILPIPFILETANANVSVFSYSLNELNQFVFVTDNGTHNSDELGRGGAVFVEDMMHSMDLTISNSQFIDNVARKSGGAIYVDGIYKNAHIDYCLLTSTGSRTTQGELVFAHESFVVVTNTNMTAERDTVDHALRSTTSSWVHLDGGVFGKSIVRSMTFTCPTGSRVSVHNSSAWFQYGEEQFLLYSKLELNCKPCINRYSLVGESLEVIHPWENRTSDPSEVRYNHITCYPCPPEATCVNGLYPKEDYWGEVYDNRVYFYKCPLSYCCRNETCITYNSCARHRTGTLCSRCQQGFSEALFSTTCLPNENCSATLVLIVATASAVLYAAFLFFQNDFKTLFLKLGKEMTTDKNKNSKRAEEETASSSKDEVEVLPAGREMFNQGKQKDQADNCSNLEIPKCIPQKQESGESSAFLVIFFYYFQEASLLNVPTSFEDHSDIPKIILQLKSLFAGLFMFRVEFFNLVLSDICTFTDLTPVSKTIFKTLFYVLMISIIVLVLLVLKCYERRSRRRYPWVGRRVLSAMVLVSMFSFQKLSLYCLRLLDCTTLRDRRVLFIDGETRCFQEWQYVILIYPLTTWIIPFTLVLTLGPSLVISSRVGYKEFLVSFLMPLPFLVSWVVRFTIPKKKKGHMKNDTFWTHGNGVNTITKRVSEVNEISEKEEETSEKASEISAKKGDVKELTAEASGIYNTLQGPSRPLYLGPVPLCWSGILLLRRILLIVVTAVTSNDFQRVLALTLLCLVFLIHHQMVLPYKGRLANMAATFSGAALLVLGLVNLVRATLQEAEFIRTDATSYLVTSLTWIDDVMLVWIPLVGVAAILVVVLLGLMALLWKKYLGRVKVHSDVHAM